MSDHSPIEKLLDDNIAEIEAQVGEAPAPSDDDIDLVPKETAEDVAEEFTWRETAPEVDTENLDQETIEAMWQSTSAYTEQYLARTQGREPSAHEQARWGMIEDGFRAHPRFWFVADCPHCDWVMGGWITDDHAAKALQSHDNRRHKVKQG